MSSVVPFLRFGSKISSVGGRCQGMPFKLVPLILAMSKGCRQKVLRVRSTVSPSWDDPVITRQGATGRVSMNHVDSAQYVRTALASLETDVCSRNVVFICEKSW